MNDNMVKVVGIVALVAAIGAFFFWYMSPYQQCVRNLDAQGNKMAAAQCVKLMSGR
jgi:hypothetical protein